MTRAESIGQGGRWRSGCRRVFRTTTAPRNFDSLSSTADSLRVISPRLSIPLRSWVTSRAGARRLALGCERLESAAERLRLQRCGAQRFKSHATIRSLAEVFRVATTTAGEQKDEGRSA